MRTALRTLLLLNIGCFSLQLWLQDSMLEAGALWPLGHGFWPWQLISSAFLHASVLHLAANMFGLWMFGRSVEHAIGSAWFMGLYAASIVTAGCMQLVAAGYWGMTEPTIGASGGVFGVLAAFALLFPRRRITLIFPPVPLPAWLFVTLYAGFELVSGVEGIDANVAHFAHLGGLVGGIATLMRWRVAERRRLLADPYERFLI